MGKLLSFSEARAQREQLAAKFGAAAIAKALTGETATAIADAIADVGYELARRGEPDEGRLVLQLSQLIRDGGSR